MNEQTKNKINATHFGEHLMIDAYLGESTKLNDQSLVLTCLHDLPAQLGMQVLAPATVHWAQPNGIKDPGGWSGIVVIAESHISIHTFPGRRFASIDIYTCRNGLPIQEVENYFCDVFEFKELETNFVIRGRKYPLQDFL